MAMNITCARDDAECGSLKQQSSAEKIAVKPIPRLLGTAMAESEVTEMTFQEAEVGGVYVCANNIK